MPLPEEVDFQVTNDPDIMGTYLYDTGGDYEHTITVSAARCAFMTTILSTMCHEMIHMSFHRQKGDKWLHHGKNFRDRCKRVGNELGLDHLEL
jgi:predicted SprT family Zn-dependent metalloprotease